MTPIEWIAQAFGLVAMFFHIFSYQQKTPRGVIVFQMFSSILFSVNYLLLGALVGMCMNIIGLMRAIVYANREKFRADHILWLIFFISLYVTSYILSFTVFGKAFTLKNALLEILPVIGMTASNISFRLQNAAMIRRLGFISSPCWLTYNAVSFSIGGVLCEAFAFCSIIIGIIRYDLKSRRKA